MPEIKPNYGISRIDQPEKKNHGFYVRITNKGKTSQKFFPDKSCGGKAKAQKMAKSYRDKVFNKLPKLFCPFMFCLFSKNFSSMFSCSNHCCNSILITYLNKKKNIQF